MKLTKKLEKAIDVYLIRGDEARKDVDKLLESIWTDYDWNLEDDCGDNQLAISCLDLFQTQVLEEENKALAVIRAHCLLTIMSEGE